MPPVESSALVLDSSVGPEGPTLVPDREELRGLLEACGWEPSTSVTLKARPLELDSLRTLAMSAAIDLDSDFGMHLARGLQPRPLPRITTAANDASTIETVRPPAALRRAAAVSGVAAKASGVAAKAKPRRRTKISAGLARAS